MHVSKVKRIGIFGGSFDPPHHGHLEISKLAIKKLFLDQVYWCVTKKNPLKTRFFDKLGNLDLTVYLLCSRPIGPPRNLTVSLFFLLDFTLHSRPFKSQPHLHI